MLKVGGIRGGVFDGWRLVKKADALVLPEVNCSVFPDEPVECCARMVWKCVSHVGVGPNVAIDDTCVMICGGESGDCGVINGSCDTISFRPSQPKDVDSEDLTAAGFCREGALPMNAALTAEKS